MVSVNGPEQVPVVVNVQVSAAPGAPLAAASPQSLRALATRFLSTTSRTEQIEGGALQPPVSERSAVGWFEATRAPCKAVLPSFCFTVNAVPKSNTPTTTTSSKGREMANSRISAPSLPPSFANLRLANLA